MIVPLGEDVALNSRSMDKILSDKIDSNIRTIILEHEASKEIIDVSKHLDTINNVGRNLERISSVFSNLANINKINSNEVKIDKLLPRLEDIANLSTMADGLDTLAKNTTSLTKLANEIDLLKGISDDLDEINYLHSIRDAIVNLNKIKTELLEIYRLRTMFHNISEHLHIIELVSEHLLAIETVAKYIREILFIYKNMPKIELLNSMRNEVLLLAKNTDVYIKALEELRGLKDKLGVFRSEVETIKNNALEDFKNKSDEVLEELQKTKDELERDKNKYLNEILELRTDIAKLKENVADRLLYLEKEYRGHTINNTHNTTNTKNTTKTENTNCTVTKDIDVDLDVNATDIVNTKVDTMMKMIEMISKSCSTGNSGNGGNSDNNGNSGNNVTNITNENNHVWEYISFKNDKPTLNINNTTLEILNDKDETLDIVFADLDGVLTEIESINLVKDIQYNYTIPNNILQTVSSNSKYKLIATISRTETKEKIILLNVLKG